MKSLSLLLSLLFVAATVSAEQIFVLFDGNCGERIHYEQAVAQQPRMDYYAYNFNLAGGQKLFLETGSEGSVTQSYLPEGYLYCNDPRLNADLVDRVNGGVDRVFLLLPLQGGSFRVQPVVMAGLLTRQADVLTYQSPLASFQFDARNAIIGVNLSYNRPGSKVYFEGRENNACNGIYLFRQLNPGGSYPLIDYRMVPEIGIIERRLGSNGTSTSGGVILAKDVNGQPLEQYLAAICAAASAQVAGNQPVTSPTAYGNSGVAAPQPFVQPESVAYATTTSAAPVTQTSQVDHVVGKGETLYAISRKYATSVDAIKTANGLSGNTLYPGQRLTVLTTTTVPATPPQNTFPATSTSTTTNAAPAYTSVPTLPYNPGNVGNSNQGAFEPTPYGNSPAVAARGEKAVYGEDIHVVQPGETMASVALKYGYTAARLREMNDVGPNEVIKIGQRLKTSDCNCPEVATSYSSGSVAAPVPAPAAATATAPARQGAGIPLGTATPINTSAVPSYRPQPAVAPTTTSPAPAAAAPTDVINNRPDFGGYVPNASAIPTRTLSDLEGRGATPAPATTPAPEAYENYPIPVQPSVYGGSPTTSPVPNAYGGTPLSGNVDYGAQNQPKRAFHTVQEGESLYGISQQYGMKVERIRELNQLGPYDLIVPFQKLYLN